MGLFDIFKEANEHAHGARLERGMKDTMRLLSTIDENVRVRSLIGFVEKRNKLLTNIRNMSSKGRIDMGRLLQDEARKKYDTDLAESCALWMVGAWIESMERKSSTAREVHSSLSDLAEGLNKAESEEQDEIYDFDDESEMVLSPNLPNITKCEPIEWFNIGDYSAAIVKDVPNIAGIPSPIEYLYVMALFSNSGSMPIFYVTAEKSFTGSVFLCAFDRQENHINYGGDSDWSNIDTFSKEAFSILEEEVARLDGVVPY